MSAHRAVPARIEIRHVPATPCACFFDGFSGGKIAACRRVALARRKSQRERRRVRDCFISALRESAAGTNSGARRSRALHAIFQFAHKILCAGAHGNGSAFSPRCRRARRARRAFARGTAIASVSRIAVGFRTFRRNGGNALPPCATPLRSVF